MSGFDDLKNIDDELEKKRKQRRVGVRRAPPSESTEHTEHSGANPHGERDSVFGSGTEHSDEQTQNTAPELARTASILDHHDELMGTLGLVDERHISRAVFLIHVSRLLGDPGRMVVKGDSSSGKSYSTECGLCAAAPEFLYVRTSGSPTSLFYSEEDFRHKTVVFYEANRLADDEDPLGAVLRTLISEGRLAYEVTVPEKRSTVLLEKDGPVAFISTTCSATLGAEIETRTLSMHSDSSDEQTARVVRSILEAATHPTPDPDLSEWHNLDRWLATGEHGVVLPWASALGSFNLSGPPRLRRDISNLLSLARAHALLHRATRERDLRGRIVATLDDYEVVRRMLADAMAVATDKAVPTGTRKIVEAVAALRAEGKDPISLRAASAKARRSTSTTSTNVHDAIDRGYLINRSQTRNQFNLDLGDPLLDGEDLLPSRDDLAAMFARRSTSVRYEKRTPEASPGAGSRGSVRSVRSFSGTAGCSAHPDGPQPGCRYCHADPPRDGCDGCDADVYRRSSENGA